jgi:hypothetical protein
VPIDLIKTHPGVGKTYITANLLKDHSDSVLWFAPTYRQAEEVQILLPEAFLFRSRSQMYKDEDLNCRFLEGIKRAQKNALNATAIFCQRKCGLIDSCPYFEQFKIAKKRRIVILMHAYLGTGIPRQLAKDLWVIDENIFSEYRQARVIGQADLDFTSSIVNRALNTAHERTGEEGISYARTIFLGLQEHLGLVQQGKTGGEFPYNVSALAWEVIHDNYEGNDEHPKGKLVVRDVLSFTDNTVLREIPGSGEEHGFPDMDYIHTAYLPRDNIIILDATQNEENLRAILGESTEIRTFSSTDYNIEQHAEVIQVYGANYGRTSLIDMDGKSTMAFEKLTKVMEELCYGEEYHLITHKKVVEHFRLTSVLGEDNANWFGNTRGLNTMKKARNLVILGTYMPPVRDLVEGARVLYNQTWDSRLEEERAVADLANTKWLPIRFTDPKHEPVHVRQRQFSNSFVQLYYQHSILAEIEQAIGRARINEPTDEKRRLVIISNHISEFVTVDTAVNIRKLMARRTEQQELIADCIEKLLLQGIIPSKISPTVIARELGSKVSIATIKRHYKDLLKEFL